MSIEAQNTQYRSHYKPANNNNNKNAIINYKKIIIRLYDLLQ